ncbi:hypothetical protein Pla144_26970 [Bythopirellula polymerisocia]|uniref:Uncharacterized protein n=1 Tax=Bythopirellula polymerisocia TaxID=2528003 RepID=A0A5C6CMB0_9BACT|nr:hypothetical protein Pla144_26970 [Bythopirellula polymerisocia]
MQCLETIFGHLGNRRETLVARRKSEMKGLEEDFHRGDAEGREWDLDQGLGSFCVIPTGVPGPSNLV